MSIVVLQLEKPLMAHTDIVYSIACSPDGQHIASASLDNTIQMQMVGSETQ